MKPATESLVQSIGSPRTYTLLDGRVVEERQGCLVDQATRHTVANSDQAAQYLLNHGLLTSEERDFVYDWGRFVFPTCGNERASRSEAIRNKTG